MSNVAVIGLGNMGRPMAERLAAAGFGVVGFDVSEAAREAAADAGLRVAADIASALDGAEVALTMLPNAEILRRVASDVLAGATPPALWIDCSTVDIETARAVSAQAAATGVAALDAPVSGGVGGATAGTLTFMVGGPEPAMADAKPYFDAMGARAVHCGASGAGQAAKVCNNMILGVSMLAVSEAFALADGVGLSREALFDVASTSSGQCWSLTTYCPVPGVGPETSADRGYAPGFAATLMLKDLALSQEAAAAAGAQTPLGARALELYEAFVAQDDAALDFSAVAPWLAAGRAPTR